MNVTIEQEKRIASIIKRQLKGMIGKIWLSKGFSNEQLSKALRGFLVSGKEISLADFLELELKKTVRCCANCGSSITDYDVKRKLHSAISAGCTEQAFMAAEAKNDFPLCWDCFSYMLDYKEQF